MFGRKERKTPLVRQPLVSLEDMRDDCIALFVNSGFTQQQVHKAGGPTPATISKWLYKETRFPRLDTMRAFLVAVGYDFVIVDSATAATMFRAPQHTRLHLKAHTLSKMPRKKKRAA